MAPIDHPRAGQGAGRDLDRDCPGRPRTGLSPSARTSGIAIAGDLEGAFRITVVKRARPTGMQGVVSHRSRQNAPAPLPIPSRAPRALALGSSGWRLSPTVCPHQDANEDLWAHFELYSCPCAEKRATAGQSQRVEPYGGGRSSPDFTAPRRSPRPLTPNLRSSADTCTDTVFGLM
jgi:hypothetical protein